jgi:hypothetical protein
MDIYSAPDGEQRQVYVPYQDAVPLSFIILS